MKLYSLDITPFPIWNQSVVPCPVPCYSMSMSMKDDAVKVLHSICQQIWKTQQWPQDWKRSVFIPISKKDNAKECLNYCTIALISHASKVMLKILQPRLKQYVNVNFQMFKLDSEKAKKPEIKLDHRKSKRVPEKHLLLLHCLC